MSEQNKKKDRLVRDLSISAGILILYSTIINATSPSSRSFLWVLGESLGFLGIFAALFYTGLNPQNRKQILLFNYVRA